MTITKKISLASTQFYSLNWCFRVSIFTLYQKYILPPFISKSFTLFDSSSRSHFHKSVSVSFKAFSNWQKQSHTFKTLCLGSIVLKCPPEKTSESATGGAFKPFEQRKDIFESAFIDYRWQKLKLARSRCLTSKKIISSKCLSCLKNCLLVCPTRVFECHIKLSFKKICRSMEISARSLHQKCNNKHKNPNTF